MAVRDIHALVGNHAGDRVCHVAEVREVEGDVFERGSGRYAAREQRSGRTADQDAVTAVCELAAQTENGLGGAGALALMRELQNRELGGTLRHDPNTVRMCSRCSYRSTHN